LLFFIFGVSGRIWDIISESKLSSFDNKMTRKRIEVPEIFYPNFLESLQIFRPNFTKLKKEMKEEGRRKWKRRVRGMDALDRWTPHPGLYRAPRPESLHSHSLPELQEILIPQSTATMKILAQFLSQCHIFAF
jgi:hypothetical protein